MITNSQEWWDVEFKKNWKNGIDGRLQTAYFMKLLIKYLPLTLYGNIIDWGCALGQGVDEIYKSDVNSLIHSVLGYDFSKVAIDEARELFPTYEFTDKFPKYDNRLFNIIVCSNVLEHFENPLPTFKQLFELAEDYVIIMTPYNQTPPCAVHPVTITDETFHRRYLDFLRVSTLLLPSEDVEMCGITQILFVYKKIRG